MSAVSNGVLSSPFACANLTGMEPVVYREEVLTIMTVLGDMRFELEEIHRILGGDDAEEEEEENA